jgi:hypothetical protein
MSQQQARAVETALARLAARVDADARLHAERQRAHREFFRGDGGGDAAEQRFLEWFLLERESESLGAAPGVVPRFATEAQVLDGSAVGVFLVLPGDGETVEARDLQDDAGFELSVPPQSLREGDMLVGRLFPTADGLWAPSTAAAVFRPGGQLAEAFRRDVERLGLDRRLQQIELEFLLLRRPDQAPSPTATARDEAPLEHLEADLDALLRAAGAEQSAATVSAQLGAAARPGAVMGPLLDQLAFETDVDLDAIRELLLRIWNAHHAGRPAAGSGTPGAGAAGSLGERLVRTLDDGLRQQRDIDELFAQIERMAGIEPDSDDGLAGDEEPLADAAGDATDADELGATGSAPGDLDPLVEEYLWETGRQQAEGAAVLRQWVALQGNAAVPHTDLEQVTGVDLLRLLLHCYLGAQPADRATAVQRAFAELQSFYDWAARTQDLDLRTVLPQCAAFVAEIDRLERASALLSTASRTTTRPVFLQVEDLAADGFGVRDDDGAHHWLRAAPATTSLLRQGDLVLGGLELGATGPTLAGPVVVLPGAARDLME